MVAAAGALSVATAASAAAATWTPPAQPARSTGVPVRTGISVTTVRTGVSGAAVGTGVSGTGLRRAGGLPPLVLTGQLALPAARAATLADAPLIQLARQVELAKTQYAAAQWQAARQQTIRLAAKKAAAAEAHRSAARAPATAQAQAQAPAAAQPAQAPAVTVPTVSGSPQQVAEAMLGSFGWSVGQFACLDPLWAHESGWSVTAYNAGSGAYGIPQALPGSRMASAGPDWQTDAATQIRWGLEYIKGTYGSPCAAWAHEQSTGWY